MNPKHVFRYGAKRQSGEQRWGFSFSIPPLVRSHLKGRPSSSLRARCISFETSNGEQSFWSDAEAAVECELWKRRLTDQFGFKFESSFNTYFDFETACLQVHNALPQVVSPRAASALSQFVQECEKLIFELLPSHPELGGHLNPEGGLNAHRELFEARKHKHQMEQDQAEGIQSFVQADWDAADSRIQWAYKLVQVAQVDEFLSQYGLGKLEAEVNVNMQSIAKLLKYTHNFHKPDEVPAKLEKIFTMVKEDRLTLEMAHRRLVETSTEFRRLVEALNNLRTDLKKGPPSKPTINTLI